MGEEIRRDDASFDRKYVLKYLEFFSPMRENNFIFMEQQHISAHLFSRREYFYL